MNPSPRLVLLILAFTGCAAATSPGSARSALAAKPTPFTARAAQTATDAGAAAAPAATTWDVPFTVPHAPRPECRNATARCNSNGPMCGPSIDVPCADPSQTCAARLNQTIGTQQRRHHPNACCYELPHPCPAAAH